MRPGAPMAPDAPDQHWKIARSFARFAIALPFSAFLSESASIPVTTGRTHDISLGGLGGMLEEGVGMGQRLWLEFVLPNAAGPMRLLSKVRHGNERRFGFQFLNITPEQQDAIRRACQGLPVV